MAVFPFIIARNKELKENQVFLQHEQIHLRQQVEMLCFFFFLWYGTEYVVRLLQYKDFDKAYRNISFEREAYANQKTPNYLQSRKFWSFTRYL